MGKKQFLKIVCLFINSWFQGIPEALSWQTLYHLFKTLTVNFLSSSSGGPDMQGPRWLEGRVIMKTLKRWVGREYQMKS